MTSNIPAYAIGVLGSSVLFAAAQLTDGLAALVLVAPLPLLATLDPQRPVRTWLALGSSYALSLVMSLGSLHALGPQFSLALGLAAPWVAAFFVIPALLAWATDRLTGMPVGLLTLPAGWTLVEMVGETVGPRVWWPSIAQPVAELGVLARLAALGGPALLTYVALSLALAALSFTAHLPARCRRGARLNAVLLLATALAWDAWERDEVVEPSRAVRIGVVQPDLPQAQKWDPSRRAYVLQMLAGSIDRLPREEVELVALPETALPGFVRYDTPLADWARDVVIRTERPLLFGALDRSDSGAETYNASFMITPFGTVTVYRKLRLAPVAESLAFLGRLEGWLEGWREIGFPTTPGAEVTLFRLRDGTAFATPICYEDAFAELARRFANAGAQLLVSLIDTERLGDSIAEQHLRRARLTAIAVGLPIVRVTNSASSSVIDRRGRTTDRIRADQLQGVLEAVLWSTATPYRRFGELLGLAIMVVLTVGMISLAAAFPRPISVSAG